MRKHEVSMKMHNDNGVLYRTLYEKDPYYSKRRIFIPTTGLNNIEIPLEDIIAERIEEAVETVRQELKNVGEGLSKARTMLEDLLAEKLESDKEQFEAKVSEKISELADKALDRLLNS